MNNKQRKILDKANIELKKIIEIIEDIKNDEDEKMNNYPENLQASEAFEIMESAVENLELAIDVLTEGSEAIEEVV